MSLDPTWIWSELLDFVRLCSAAFPQGRASWSDSLMAFFYHAGKESGYEVRCGDWAPRWKTRVWGSRTPSYPPRYCHFSERWNVKGLLEFDVSWVSPGFGVLVPGEGEVPTERHVHLAYEHEDTTYNTSRGTRLWPVLDEVRKIGSVRTNLKALSLFSSQTEAAEGTNLPPIQAEIRRFPQAAHLTDAWVVLQFCRYERPGTRRKITQNREPRILLWGVQLRGDGGDPRLLGQELLPVPGSLAPG